MPPLRTPLRSISGNRPKGSEISPYIRGQVIGKASEGADPTSIAKDLKLTRSTVNYTLQQDELRNDGHSLPRKPRKKSYTDADERRILRHVRLNPKDTYQQVIDQLELGCRRETLRRSSRGMAYAIGEQRDARSLQKLTR
jgi:hypothetical protein